MTLFAPRQPIGRHAIGRSTDTPCATDGKPTRNQAFRAYAKARSLQQLHLLSFLNLFIWSPLNVLA